MIKYLTIALALIGLGLGVWAVARSSVEPRNIEPRQPPSINPYPQGVAGTGLIEPAGGSVQITAPEAGLVVAVFVDVNDRVAKGDKLFQLDPRTLEAQLLTANAAVDAAQAQLDRLNAMPRAEDVAPLYATVRQAEVRLADAQDLLKRTEQAVDRDAGTPGELARRRFAVEGAEALLAEARAQLQRLEAGAWEQDVKVAEADLAQANARAEALKTELDRRTVRAPSAGVVLKRWIEPGEFAGSFPGTGALPGTGMGTFPGAGGGAAVMVIGDVSQLCVRAQIDEMDMPRVRSGARAVARLRGMGRHELSLKMHRIEPLAQPKQQLAGTNLEFIDTRIVEVLFDVVEPPDVPVYPGQLVDVFVEAERHEGTPPK